MASAEDEDRPASGCPGYCIAGWRRRCIFCLLLVLMAMIVANFALTLWIMGVMRIDFNGMGPIKIISGGVRIEGLSVFPDGMAASTIRSANNEPMSIVSAENFTMYTVNADGDGEQRLFLDEDQLECRSNNFSILDTNGNVLFSATPDEVVLGAESINMIGEGGVLFEDSLCTPHVKSEAGSDLTLESMTSSLRVESAKRIDLSSGDIQVSSFGNIKLQSNRGSIVLNSEKVEMKNLNKANPSMGLFQPKTKKMKFSIYQLCVCRNGRLFLANADGVCETYDSDYICM